MLLVKQLLLAIALGTPCKLLVSGVARLIFILVLVELHLPERRSETVIFIQIGLLRILLIIDIVIETAGVDHHRCTSLFYQPLVL